jgi:hypothetical protein
MLSGEGDDRFLVSLKKDFKGKYTEEFLAEQIFLSKN